MKFIFNILKFNGCHFAKTCMIIINLPFYLHLKLDKRNVAPCWTYIHPSLDACLDIENLKCKSGIEPQSSGLDD